MINIPLLQAPDTALDSLETQPAAPHAPALSEASLSWLQVVSKDARCPPQAQQLAQRTLEAARTGPLHPVRDGLYGLVYADPPRSKTVPGRDAPVHIMLMKTGQSAQTVEVTSLAGMSVRKLAEWEDGSHPTAEMATLNASDAGLGMKALEKGAANGAQSASPARALQANDLNLGERQRAIGLNKAKREAEGEVLAGLRAMVSVHAHFTAEIVKRSLSDLPVAPTPSPRARNVLRKPRSDGRLGVRSPAPAVPRHAYSDSDLRRDRIVPADFKYFKQTYPELFLPSREEAGVQEPNPKQLFPLIRTVLEQHDAAHSISREVDD